MARMLILERNTVIAVAIVAVLATLVAFGWSHVAPEGGSELEAAGTAAWEAEAPRRHRVTAPDPVAESAVDEREPSPGGTPLRADTRPHGAAVPIRGRVIHDDDGSPIPGAEVRLYFELDDDVQFLLGRCRSDLDGAFAHDAEQLARFSAPVLDAGGVRVVVEKDGFAPFEEGFFICPEEGIAEGDCDLVRGSGLRGRVVDEYGRPVGNGTVTVSRRGASGEWKTVEWDTLLPDGTFGLGLDLDASGAVRVEVQSPAGHLDLREVTVPEDDVLDLGDVVLRELGVIAGRMLYPSGRPAAGVWLKAWEVETDAGDDEVPGLGDACTTTDAEGRFRLSGLRPGREYWFHHPGSDDEETARRYRVPCSGVDLVYVGRRIEVVVTDERGEPFRGALVRVDRLLRDPAGRPKIENEEEEYATRPGARIGFDLEQGVDHVVAAAIELGAEQRRVERLVPASDVELEVVRLVLAEPGDRTAVLRVDHPGVGRIRDFRARLYSPTSGRLMQQLAPDEGGRARVTVPPGTWRLVVESGHGRDEYHRPTFVVNHEELVRIPRHGSVARDIAMLEGGRVAVHLARAAGTRNPSRITGVFERLDDGGRHMVVFAKSSGCCVTNDVHLHIGTSSGVTALAPGRYRLIIDSDRHRRAARIVNVTPGGIARVDVTLRARDS